MLKKILTVMIVLAVCLAPKKLLSIMTLILEHDYNDFRSKVYCNQYFDNTIRELNVNEENGRRNINQISTDLYLQDLVKLRKKFINKPNTGHLNISQLGNKAGYFGYKCSKPPIDISSIAELWQNFSLQMLSLRYQTTNSSLILFF